MKKIISLMVAIVMVISTLALTTISVSAEVDFPALDTSKANFKIDTVNVTKAGDVSVPITVNNNPGIWAANFQVAFDTTNLTFVEVDTTGSVFGEVMSSCTDGVVTLYCESSSFDNITANGVIANLKFTLASNASYGTYNVGFTKVDRKSIINKDSQDVDLTYGNGGVAYAAPATTTTAAAPGKPSIKSLTLYAKSTAKLTWGSTSRANRYYVYVTLGSTKVLYSYTTGTTYYVKGLKAGKKYTFKVKAYNTTSKKSSSYSSAKYITTLSTSKPSVKVTGAKKSITIYRKSSITGAVSYQFQYGLKKSFSGAKSVYTTSSKKVVKSLKSKKTYYVRVRAYNTVNGKKSYGSWSTTRYAKTK